MGEKSAEFHAEGGDGQLRWWYRAAISRSGSKVSIDVDASYGGHELHVWMSDDVPDSSRVGEHVRQWMSGSGIPSEARLIFERLVSEQLPEGVKHVASRVAVNKCAVCLEALENGWPLTKLRCSHVFHRHCAHKWLTVRRNCPLCRAPVSTPDVLNMGLRHQRRDQNTVSNRPPLATTSNATINNNRRPGTTGNVNNNRRDGQRFWRV